MIKTTDNMYDISIKNLIPTIPLYITQRSFFDILTPNFLCRVFYF